MSMLITAATVVTGSEILRPGWIEVDGRTVVGLGPGEPPRALTDADVALGDVTVVPGFVDMHTHGGGGEEHGSDSLPGGFAREGLAVVAREL